MTSILPPHSGGIELALDALAEKSVSFDVPISALVDPDRCPAVALPWLADYFSVDAWDAEWPDSIKRDVIRESIWVHQRKGSIGSVRRALSAAGYPNAEIIEFTTAPRLDDGRVLDDGARLSDLSHWADYEVIIDNPIQQRRAAVLRSILDQVAPARCRLVAVRARGVIALDEGRALDEGWTLNATVVLEDS